MNFFLEFKSKQYDSKYHGNLDTYTAHMIFTHMILGIAALPIVPLNQFVLNRDQSNLSHRIKVGVEWITFFLLLMVLGILARAYRSKLAKYQRKVRWILDLFYTGLSAYLAILFWDGINTNNSSPVEYMIGWWHCLICYTTLSVISRWYLKAAALLMIVSRLTIGYYMISFEQIFITVMIEIIVFLLLNTYFYERDEKRRFIEKQKIHEESQIFREILDQATQGIIICDLQVNVQFKNWTNGKYSWWNEEKGLAENFDQIFIEQHRVFTENHSEINIDAIPDQREPQAANLSYIIDKLAQNLRSNPSGFSDQADHQMQNLMLVTGKALNRTTKSNYLLEIRIMRLVFRDTLSLALIFTDITERNLIASLQDNNDYKNRLLASVSHELRTPLNASLNFIQAAIEDKQLPANIRDEYLLPSLTSNQILLHLINDILDFSQMSANKLRLVYETCDISKALKECVNLMKMQANRKGIELLLDLDIQTQSNKFTTDHNRVKQILLNLLSNAVKFTLHGTIKVHATLCETMDHGKVLKISVQDTGIGISEEGKRQLFKSFEKIELGDRAFINSTGVGLGLVISNNLVLMLGPGGNANPIKIESEMDKGTKFSFWIVNKESNLYHRPELSQRSEDYDKQIEEMTDGEFQRMETQNNLLVTKTQSTGFNLGTLRAIPGRTNELSLKNIQVCACPAFLIVDDDVFNITALSTILKQLGHTCSIAYNGKQAIERVLERENKRCGPDCKPFKLIFMDCSMPIMDGYEATKELKQLMEKSEVPKIPILGCTAFVQEKEKQKGLAAGMDGYCIKPINRDKISDWLKQFNL